MNFGSGSSSSTNQQILQRVAQNVDTWRSDGDEKKKNQNPPIIISSRASLDTSHGPERNSLPAPKAIIIPLKEGKAQAGYEELSRRVIQSTLEQNGIKPSNIEMEELMALPASKKMDMHGWLDKDWRFHDKPGLMPSAAAHVDANGNKVYGYKMTLSPQFQQGVLNDYAKIKTDLAATPDKKAVIDMTLNERLTETVKIAYEKRYISKEVKEQLGSLTPEELATAFALGGAIGIAATDAQVAAALGPIGGGLALAYTTKQMAEFDHIARGSARATNREQLDQPAKDFGAWMGSLSKDGVLALVGAASAFTAPKVMPKVEQVITNKVNGVKEALTEKPSSLGQPLPATANAAPTLNTPQTPKAGKTPLEKINDTIEARRIGDPEPGTAEHKSWRWESYQQNNVDNPKRLSYETWSKIYEKNMTRAKTSNNAVEAFRQKLGWGATEVAVTVEFQAQKIAAKDVPPKSQSGITTRFDPQMKTDIVVNSSRRLDVADVVSKRAIEHKTGYITKKPEINWEITRDKELVKQGWDITWHFEGKASTQLVQALKEGGIKVSYAEP